MLVWEEFQPDVMVMSEGLAPATIRVGSGTQRKVRVGFVDCGGNVVIAPFCDRAWPFNEGFAIFERDNRYGVISRSGDIVVKPTISWLSPFVCAGFALARTKESAWYIDCRGDGRVPGRFRTALAFSEGVAWVTDEDDVHASRLIDMSGKEVLRLDGHLARQGFREGRCSVMSRETGMWKYIDRSGVARIEGIAGKPFMEEGRPFFGGTAVYRDAEFDDTGEWEINGIVDRHGHVIWATRWIVDGPQEVCVYPFTNGRALFRGVNGYGFIGRDGNVAIPAIYVDSKPFSDGVAAVGRLAADGERRLRYGAIDARGQVVLDFQYTRLSRFSEGVAHAIWDDNREHSGYIDILGRRVWSDES